ncbi:Sodium/hydrogen exchanger family-domain-containing protein [Leucosporidium creatinivorum]|uniref:Sodium/hydrogen exchanger family-domain-containing protein n=1 Tax=Leucosporidium creatinivorum TaxID=106004 RepID=A0A1Y2C968_9BASI|nr:Sodium/hydrogen exchanger family-domain-containing protein [Leucosporidium creatinivorum]
MSSTISPSTTASIAKVTATIVAQAGATLLTTLPPAPTATKAAAASIFDPSKPNPVAFDSTNPLILFILQAFLIVTLSRILGYFLGKIRQPKVIAEVVAGLLVGPSVMGRIPNFTRRIFPTQSVPYLSLVANIGLCFFLFLVGMETDFTVFRRNARASLSISLIGMVIPFALGAAVSKPIYDNFVGDGVKFGTFLLFIGVANAITAFPVLARILTELEMLQNHVGVIVLAAGVGNDVVGWVLLALAIALVNAASGLIVLYVILTSIGWILFLFLLGRPALQWLGRKTGSYGEKGPSETMTCIVVFTMLASSWVTDRIGIHAIFGSFLVGLIVPHKIRHALTEKIEDLVAVLLLPLYFALSGLKTDLGLLANGSIWGYVVCVIVVAFFSKFLSCGIVAKLNGMDWRESGAVGSLMACKGLVELIVLNIGLNAGILNPEVFAMFVTMALVTTFATTPLALAFYPKTFRLESERRHREKHTASISTGKGSDDGDEKQTASPDLRTRFTVVLEQFDHLPAVFAFCKLLRAPPQYSALPAAEDASEKEDSKGKTVVAHSTSSPLSISALRLIELTDRTSALMRASTSKTSLLAADTLSTIFRTFTLSTLGIPTTSSLSITPGETYASSVAQHAEEQRSQVLVLPWALKETAHAKEEEEAGGLLAQVQNPFASLFGKSGAAVNEGSPLYASFVRRVFAEAACDVALFVDRGVESASRSLLTGRSHIFFAFHGGSDDRACLALLVQLVARNPSLEATIVRVERAAEPTQDDRDEEQGLSTKANTRDGRTSEEMSTPILFSQLTVQGGGATDTVYPTIHHDIESDTADSLAFTQHLTPLPPRINFAPLSTALPLHLTLARARALSSSLSVPLTILTGRSRRDAPSHTNELATYLKANLEAVQQGLCASSEVRRSLGDLGTAYCVSGVGANLLVVQAGLSGVGKSKDV